MIAPLTHAVAGTPGAARAGSFVNSHVNSHRISCGRHPQGGAGPPHGLKRVTRAATVDGAVYLLRDGP